jgi:hypothetical protein
VFAVQGAIHAWRIAHPLDRETLLHEITGKQFAQTGVVIDDEYLVASFSVHMVIRSVTSGEC